MNHLLWRKFFTLILLTCFFLLLPTAAGLAQSLERPSGLDVPDSSITICLDNSLEHPDEVSFSGDLGSFTLSGIYPDPAACHSAESLAAGSYTIIETLPAGYFGQAVSCQETAGSGSSQWQTTKESVTIDLAGASDVKCTFRSLPNPDEPNDTMEQATPTNYGATISAAIGPHPDVGPDGDRDFYSFQGFAGDTLLIDGDTYEFFASSNLPWLYLRDEGGTIIAQANSNYSPFLTLEHDLPETGTYYLEFNVVCSGSSDPCSGAYALYLGIKDAHEPNDTPGTATAIDFGDALRGNMDNDTGDPIVEKDVDYFHFQGMAGDEVVIEIKRFNDETILDCALEDDAQMTLAEEFGPSCIFEHTLTADGAYYIKVFSQFHDGLINRYWRGPYELSLAYKNNVPIANPDSYAGYAGHPLVIAAPGVLENDTDADGDSLTAVLSMDVQHGTLALSSDGSFTYDADPGYIGDDSFLYYAFDGRDQSEPVTVTLTIDPTTVYLPVVLSE